MRSDDRANPLAVEVLQEKASAYFAACRKMVEAIEALHAFDAALGSRALDSNGKARRSELVEQAAERVYYVVIQREALKLPCSDEFFDHYGIPAEIKARLRPARRK